MYVAGDMIGNQLRLVSPIEGGAMGSVWVASHRTLKTQVAVKFVGDRLQAEDPGAVERFRHEAAAAARIKSPHVASVFDHDFTEDGTPYIVMELLDGETLMQRLERAPLTLVETAHLVTHVGRALARAHDAGIIHRDVKPANIFLCTTADGEMFCKVFDFGIAKQVEMPELDGITLPGLLVGTPEFMSPERFSARSEITHHADLWALAVTAFYALTRELPFSGDSFGEVCSKLLAEDPTPIRSLRADVPDAVSKWFTKALAKKPNERFQSAGELAKAFTQAVATTGAENLHRFSSLPAQSYPSVASIVLQGTRPPSAPPASSKHGVMALAGGAMVFAVGMIAMFMPHDPPPSPAADQPNVRPTVTVRLPPPVASVAQPSTQSSARPGVQPRAAVSATPRARTTSTSAPKSPPPPTKKHGYDWAF